jgi:hypothetical protein
MNADERIFDDLRAEWESILDEEGAQGPAAELPEAGPDGRLGPGRPGWAPDVFLEHWREAVDATPSPYTFGAVAANFRQLDGALGIDPEYLRRLRKRFPEYRTA